MAIEIPISSKGQIVIPKDVRDALHLEPGQKLTLTYVGRRIVLDAPGPPHETISYEEFRRRVPKYNGPPVPVEEMTAQIGDLFKNWKV